MVALATVACTSPAEKEFDTTILLTVENRTGAQLWYFSYADCGSEDYTGLLASDEYLADGDDLSSGNLPPGCYDLYIEDEFGCFSSTTTEGNVEGGQEYTWTAQMNDLRCP